MQQFKESDWKLFRKRIPEWQERYMERLCRAYVDLLSEEGLPSEKFWELEKRIQQDKRMPGVCLERKRSMLHLNLVMLLRSGAISRDDLEGFSEELLDSLKFVDCEE